MFSRAWGLGSAGNILAMQECSPEFDPRSYDPPMVAPACNSSAADRDKELSRATYLVSPPSQSVSQLQASETLSQK